MSGVLKRGIIGVGGNGGSPSSDAALDPPSYWDLDICGTRVRCESTARLLSSNMDAWSGGLPAIPIVDLALCVSAAGESQLGGSGTNHTCCGEERRRYVVCLAVATPWAVETSGILLFSLVDGLARRCLPVLARSRGAAMMG